MKKKHYKYLVWHGKVTKVECKDHSYSWSGKIPCTGLYRCVLCGKEKGIDHKQNA